MSFWAAETLDVDLTDEALRVKFHRSLDWLKHLVSTHMEPLTKGWGAVLPGVRFRLLDATMLSLPGSSGTDWVLHLTYDLESGWVVGIELTTDKEAEALHRCRAQGFDIPIGDRAYGLAKHYALALEKNLFPLLRAQLTSLRVADPKGEVKSTMEWVQRAERGDLDQEVEIPYNGVSLPARLVWCPMPPEAAGRARQALRERAKKEGYTPSAQGLALAGWVVLLTRLPREHFPASLLLPLYRQRWQIELFFKRCRQLLRLGPTRKLGRRLLQVVVWTKMLVLMIMQTQFPALFPDDEEEQRVLWRLTRVLLMSLTSTVFGSLTEGWLRWVDKLSERPRRRGRAEQQLPAFRRAAEGWQPWDQLEVQRTP